jgi:hypothetical protein
MLKVCLMVGQDCYWLKYRKVGEQNPLQIRTCRADFPCNQQLIIAPQELKIVGACEKASTCPSATEACKLTYNLDAFLPKKRWIFCIGWKRALLTEKT